MSPRSSTSMPSPIRRETWTRPAVSQSVSSQSATRKTTYRPAITCDDFRIIEEIITGCGMESDAVPRKMFLAIEAGEIQGCGGYLKFDGVCWLASIAIRQQHRRRGLGRGIVDEIIRDADHNGCTSHWLETLFWNIPFYTKLGFSHVKAREVPPAILALRTNRRCSFLQR